MADDSTDKPAWKRGLILALKTIPWPNTLFAIFGVWVFSQMWLEGLNAPLFDDYLEFLIGIPVIAIFFNLLALNKNDHFLFGCTVSLCLVVSAFYLLNQKDGFSYRGPLPDASKVRTSALHKAGQTARDSASKETLQNGKQMTPFRGAKGPAVLKIINGSSLDAAVKLLDNAPKARTRLFVYVRANSEATIKNIANGSYELRFTLGTAWDRQSHKFRSDGSYYKLARPLELYQGETGARDAPHEIMLPAGAVKIDENVF